MSSSTRRSSHVRAPTGDPGNAPPANRIYALARLNPLDEFGVLYALASSAQLIGDIESGQQRETHACQGSNLFDNSVVGAA